MMGNRLKNVALPLVVWQLVAEVAKEQLYLSVLQKKKNAMLQKQNGVTAGHTS